MTHDPVPHADRDHSEQPTRYAQGGMIPPAPEGSDRVPAWLSPGCHFPDTNPRITARGRAILAMIEAVPTLTVAEALARLDLPTPSTAAAGSDPTQGTSRSVSARVVRASEAQVEAALDVIAETLGWRSLSRATLARRVADAVVAAGDADEVSRLRAEVDDAGLTALYASEGLAAWREIAKAEHEKAEAAEVERDEIAGRLSALLCELTGGRLSKTTYDVRTMVAEIDSAYDDAQREERTELERLAEVVARVEALADERDVLYPPRFGRTPSENYVMGYRVARADLRAALSGPTPAETPQNGPEPALSREQGTSGQSGEGEALRGAENGAPSIGDTCCGKCSGGTCYVDGVTGA